MQCIWIIPSHTWIYVEFYRNLPVRHIYLNGLSLLKFAKLFFVTYSLVSGVGLGGGGVNYFSQTTKQRQSLKCADFNQTMETVSTNIRNWFQDFKWIFREYFSYNLCMTQFCRDKGILRDRTHPSVIRGRLNGFSRKLQHVPGACISPWIVYR